MIRPLPRLFSTSHYFLLATLFFIGLELAITFHQWLVVVMAVLLAVLVYGIFLIRSEEGGRFRAGQMILPVMAAVGLTGLAFFLSEGRVLHGYLLVASLIFYGLLRHGARLAYPTWNWIIALVVLFVNLAVVLGIRFHMITYTPVTITLAAIYAVIFLLSYQSLSRVAPSMRYAVLLSCGLSLALTQIAWTLQFLPLSFLVQSGIIVAFYYIFFYCLVLSLEGHLTRRHMGEYALAGGLAISVLLLSARWL